MNCLFLLVDPLSNANRCPLYNIPTEITTPEAISIINHTIPPEPLPKISELKMPLVKTYIKNIKAIFGISQFSQFSFINPKVYIIVSSGSLSLMYIASGNGLRSNNIIKGSTQYIV
jgi:hypothetical protein